MAVDQPLSMVRNKAWGGLRCRPEINGTYVTNLANAVRIRMQWRAAPDGPKLAELTKGSGITVVSDRGFEELLIPPVECPVDEAGTYLHELAIIPFGSTLEDQIITGATTVVADVAHD